VASVGKLASTRSCFNKPYSDSEGVSLETNTQTDASHFTMTPTGIESNE
jgi:hypothetical protein